MQTFLGSSGASFLTDGIRERWSWKTLPTLVKLAMFFLAMGIFISGFFAHRLIAADTAAAPETFIMAPDKQILFFSRIFFFIVGWVLLVLYLKRLRLEGDNRGRLQRLVYGAFALVTLAEILGRYLFYASFYRIGL
jgi:hypothetical protein